MIRNVARLLLTAGSLLPFAVTSRAQQIQYQPFKLPNATFTEAIGVNNAGNVIGFYYDEALAHGFVFRGGKVFNIDDPAGARGTTTPKAINAAGQIVGTYRTNSNQERAFLYVNDKFSDIKAPGFVADSEANGINNSGQIVGMYTDGGSIWHGYLFDSVTRVFQTIDVPNALYTWGAGINDSGLIALFSMDSQNMQHAWLYDGTAFTNIDVPGLGSTIAQAINNQGAVTLIATNGVLSYGFVYQAGQFTSVVLPGALVSEPRGINDRGEVVGNYILPNEFQGSFLAMLPGQ